MNLPYNAFSVLDVHTTRLCGHHISGIINTSRKKIIQQQQPKLKEKQTGGKASDLGSCSFQCVFVPGHFYLSVLVTALGFSFSNCLIFLISVRHLSKDTYPFLDLTVVVRMNGELFGL